MTAGLGLVLVHGAGGSRRSWDPLIAAARRLEPIALDLPGRHAAPPAPPGSIEEAAAWVRQTVAGDYVIAGHSMGGAVALEAALSGDPRIAGLVLIATGARLRVSAEILAEMEAAVHERRTGRVPAAGVDPGQEGVPPETALADWRNADRFDRLADPRLRRLAIPSLILAGSKDLLTPPKYSVWLKENLPSSTLVTIEGAGHDLHVTHASKVARHLDAFDLSV